MVPNSVAALIEEDWRDALVRLLSSPKQTDWDQARTLKLSRMPSHLFRYRPPTKYSFDGLVRQSAWLSRASEFNDLFDTSARMDAHRLLNHVSKDELSGVKRGLPPELAAMLPSDGRGFVEAMDEIFKKAIEKEHGAEMAQKVTGFFSKFTRQQGLEMQTRLSTFTQRATKVACFCEINDDSRMWAHYADNHRGFCVEYPFVSLPRDDVRLRWMMPVIYRQEPFDLADLIIEIGRTPNPWGAYLTAMHKLAEWDYEREWRMIDTVGDDVAGREILLPTPSRIFLGYRISDPHRALIESIAKDQGIALFDMAPAPEGFALKARPSIPSVLRRST